MREGRTKREGERWKKNWGGRKEGRAEREGACRKKGNLTKF